MQHTLIELDNLRRPRLLIRAARIGTNEYRRNTHLRRHLGFGALPRSDTALAKLLELERDMNDLRRAGDSAYSAMKHVDLLIAMMGEARILRATRVSNLHIAQAS